MNGTHEAAYDIENHACFAAYPENSTIYIFIEGSEADLFISHPVPSTLAMIEQYMRIVDSQERTSAAQCEDAGDTET